MAVDVGSAVGYLDLNIKGFLDNLKTAEKEAEKSSGNIESKFKSIGGSLSSAGTSLTKGVTAPLAGIGTAGLKVATDFEKSMSGVKAITQATDSDFQKLRDTAINLGAQTSFSSQEVADGMTEMAKAGWSSQQIIDGMAGVLDAAAASGEDLGNVSTILADAITGFGLEASDSTKVADLLTQAANSGTIGINDLGESFKYIAPVAGSMGYSIEDVTTALSAMSQAGIKGSQAGTALRTLLTNMAKPTDAMASAMDELGVSLYDNEGNMYSLNEVLDQLRSGMGNLMVSNDEYKDAIAELDSQLANGEITQKQYNTQVEDLTRKTFGAEEAEKARAAATLAGKEGMSGLLSITNMTQEEYDSLSKSMEDSAGVADETAAVMQDNLQSKVEQLGGSLESLAIRLGDFVIPKLTELAEKLTGMVEKFINLDPETQKFILKVVGIAAAVGPVLVVIGKFVTAIGSIIGAVSSTKAAFKTLVTNIKNVGEAYALQKAGLTGFAGETSKLGVALASVTGPMIAIAAVIGVVVAAFVTLWNTNEDFRNSIINTWNEIKATFDNLTQGIVDRINALGFDFESFGEIVWAIWNGFCSLLAPVFENAFSLISDIFQGVSDTILGILDIFIGIFTGNWEQAWNGVKEIGIAIWNLLKAPFETALNALKGIADAVLGWFGTSWDEAWTSVVEFFQNLWNGIVEWWNNLWDGIFTFFTELWTSISEWWIGMLTGIQEWWYNIWTSIGNFFTNLWNGIILFFTQTIPNVFNQFVQFFMNLPYNIGYAIGYILAALVQFGINAWNWVITEIPKIINGIIDWFKQLPGRIWTWLANVVTNIGKWGTNVYKNMTSAVTKAINAVINWFKQLPGKIWTWLVNTVTNIGKWGANVYSSMSSAVSNAISSVVSWFSSLPGKIWTWLVNVVTNIGSWGSNMLSSAKTAVTNVVTNVVNGFQQLPGKILEIGKNIITGLWNGISSMGDWIWDQISGFCGGILDGFKSFFGIASPSKVMAKVVGAFLPPGIAKGFESAMPKATRDMKSELDSSISDLEGESEIDVGVNTKANALTSKFKDVYNSVVSWFDSLNDKFEETVDKMIETLMKFETMNETLVPAYDYNVFAGKEKNNQSIDYEKLASVLYRLLEKAPIQYNPEFVFEKGDVYLDKDKVGKSLDAKLKQIEDRRKRG